MGEHYTPQSVTIQYGSELELGARQFPDLDVAATNAKWCEMVEACLQEYLPGVNVTIIYHPHFNVPNWMKIAIEGDIEVEQILEELYRAENVVLAGELGAYVVGVEGA